MVLRKRTACAVGLIFLVGQPASGGPAADATLSAEPIVLYDYPGNHGFLHATGYHVPNGWAARYRIDGPGYLVQGRVTGGEALEEGMYRYVFFLTPLQGALGGFLKRATDVVRVEVWDRTANERLLVRTFQMADFPPEPGRLFREALTFSTSGRAGHRFEPRLYWTGFCSLYLRHVQVERLPYFTPAFLSAKADVFEAMMREEFIERGFVVERDLHGQPADTGDAAIWTGLYAAAEAWRYEATHAREAQSRMENALRALHQLQIMSDRTGTLVRYVDRQNRPLGDTASKDTYTGFFFAVAQCIKDVQDKTLREQLLQDTAALGNHLLDHDLAFVPAQGRATEFNPYFGDAYLQQYLTDLGENASARRKAIRVLQVLRLYFLSHGQRPWPGLRRLIHILKDNDMDDFRKNLVTLLNGALGVLGRLQQNVQRSDSAYRQFLADQGKPDAPYPAEPYGKLDRLLVRALYALGAQRHGPAIQRTSDLKVLPSQALHALHLIKVAAEILPKPNRFDSFYRDNLWANKCLLKTVVDWHDLDEEALTAVYGHARAAAMRSGSEHLVFLALFDLARLERDPAIRNVYGGLLNDEYALMQDEHNAMVHVMRAVLKLPPDQAGIGFWALGLYPVDRRGLGGSYWRRHHNEWAARYGGEESGQAHDPVPIDARQRDCFIWQRSARSIGGDDDQKIYPPMDYLFVYWLARSAQLL